MANSPSFVQHALELLEPVGPVQARPMFGGHSLKLSGNSIGIIDDDWLFLRVDDSTRPRFEEAGSRAFTYTTKNGTMTMNGYWSLPEEAIDDPEVAAKWGRLAAEVAARAGAKKAATEQKKKTTVVKKAAAKSPVAASRKAGSSVAKTPRPPSRRGKKSAAPKRPRA